MNIGPAAVVLALIESDKIEAAETTGDFSKVRSVTAIAAKKTYGAPGFPAQTRTTRSDDALTFARNNDVLG